MTCRRLVILPLRVVIKPCLARYEAIKCLLYSLSVVTDVKLFLFTRLINHLIHLYIVKLLLTIIVISALVGVF